MSKQPHEGLSRRERQIMDIIYRRGRVSAADVLAGMSDAPSYSAVRALLRILEEKGFLEHRQAGQRYIFAPTTPVESAGRSALRHLVDTFFKGSTEKAVATLLGMSAADLSDEDLDRLQAMIAEAKREGR